MVSLDKFYVYGGGRWREVDSGSGRIDGWGRAKFLVATGGKLQVAKSGPVLAALRALSSAQPSAARPGPALPYKYPLQNKVSNGIKKAGCEHCHRCHHNNNGNIFSSKFKENKTSVAIQCGSQDICQQTSRTDQRPQTSKRKRDSTSSEDMFHRKLTTVATVHSPRKPDAKRRRISTINKSTKVSKRIQSSSSSDDDQDIINMNKAQKSPRLRPRRPLKRKRSLSVDSSVKKISDRDKNNIKYLKSRSKKVLEDSSSDKSSLKRQTRQNVSIVISTDESDIEHFQILKRNPSKRRKSSSTDAISSADVPLKHRPGQRTIEKSSPNERNKHKIGPKKSLEISSSDATIKISPKKSIDKTSTDEHIKHKAGPRRAKKLTSKKYSKKHKMGPKKNNNCKTHESVELIQPNPESKNVIKWFSKRTESVTHVQDNNTQIKSSLEDPTKELVIDDNDVKTLRLFLQRYYSDEDLLRFDTDDDYKRIYFYNINPLVNIERCPRIAQMIRESDPDDHSGLSLRDFASKLGLRSISDVSTKAKRYKTRKRMETSYVNNINSTRDKNNTDKENKDRPVRSRTNLQKDKVLTESMNKPKGREKIIQNNKRESRTSDKKKEINNTEDMIELSSDSETDVPSKPALITEIKKPLLKKIKIIAKRSALKEYTNLEDHAIVSWVSIGGRASQVNGNRLWRQLEEQFARLAGHGRTWHSLRNRYLRYILPRLGALALPPALQRRLRACAATGELKARKKEPRRNSIFTLPPRGASSRRLPTLATRDASPVEKRPPDNNTVPLPRAASPRYSDVTRTFTRKHRAQQNSSERSDSTTEEKNKMNRKSSPVEASKSRSISRPQSKNKEDYVVRRRRSKSMSLTSESESNDSGNSSTGSNESEILPKRKSIRIDQLYETKRKSICSTQPLKPDRDLGESRTSTTERSLGSQSQSPRLRDRQRSSTDRSSDRPESNRSVHDGKLPIRQSPRRKSIRLNTSDRMSPGKTETKRRTLIESKHKSSDDKITSVKLVRSDKKRRLFNHKVLL